MKFLAMGRCMIQDHKPYCNFTLNALTRASGLAQMTRVPQGGSIKFDSCSIVMDGASVSSKTCFQVLCPAPASQETPLSDGKRHSKTAMACTLNIKNALCPARLASGCSFSSLSPSSIACIAIAGVYAMAATLMASGWAPQQHESALGHSQQDKEGRQQLAVCLPSTDQYVHTVLERQTSKQSAASRQGGEPENASYCVPSPC